MVVVVGVVFVVAEVLAGAFVDGVVRDTVDNIPKSSLEILV